MSDEQTPKKANPRRTRGPRGKLKKHQQIENVIVEEPFALNEPINRGAAKVGEGCYITATINNKRYYGLLVEKDALKVASLMHYQDEAAGLDLNRRMKVLSDQQEDRKPPATESSADSGQDSVPHPGAQPDPASSKSASLPPNTDAVDMQASLQVQKFRYVDQPSDGGQLVPGYRMLLATYANVEAAAEDNVQLISSIRLACQAGGNFVGEYYYRYEAEYSTLNASGPASSNGHGVRMSMGFECFLQKTRFPEWFPLSNLQINQQQFLDTLGMKKDQKGNVVWDQEKALAKDVAGLNDTLIPMEPRSRYRVVVVGGGISGLSCCLELFRLCDREGIDVEVVLVEGRSRLGGRLLTDRETFKESDGTTAFPVDLGASWIHGIDQNPLAALAREAGAEFVQSSEEVKMLQGGMQEVDGEKDEFAGQLFDKLLDLAVEDCWKSGEQDASNPSQSKQASESWYASKFTQFKSDLKQKYQSTEQPNEAGGLLPPHRLSSDTSVDQAIGRVIAGTRLAEFAALSEEERRMLFWNMKNVEYALGANLKDLSMQFWDIDERNAFEGDHVILRQGYSTVIECLYQQLARRVGRFTSVLDFPVQKLEYARKTSTSRYLNFSGRHRRCVELSDSCRVTAENGTDSFNCDFVVSAVPLGVLKESVRDTAADGAAKIEFDPPLPSSKTDAIQSVGFGLLDKIYLQFPSAFWRGAGGIQQNLTQFGNASGVNPHHYIFYDMGKILHPATLSHRGDPPAILMTLVSGREAAQSECLSEEDIVNETMETLRTLFGQVPLPIRTKVTRWGRDRFSRGSYTYLPPGTTDQDFHILQSPVNGNGDLILLAGAEIGRLFFCGEHTTSLHPSMAHGAMLSGYRAAQEVVDAMSYSFQEDESVDRSIPLSLFRLMNPNTTLHCALCNLPGTRLREGSLLAFKRGSRNVLCHNNCAENCPEVEVNEGSWKNVIKACNRGRLINCSACGRSGASIGCGHEQCFRSFHFSCAEDTGWRFDIDGKEFLCDQHWMADGADSRRISMAFYLSKVGTGTPLVCSLCGLAEGLQTGGELLAYQQRSRRALVHKNCARYTNIMDISENEESRSEYDFRNMVAAIDQAHYTFCSKCGGPGATIRCTENECSLCFHYHCTEGWNFDGGAEFRCFMHRQHRQKRLKHQGRGTEGGIFQHALFSSLAEADSDKLSAEIRGFSENVDDSGPSGMEQGKGEKTEQQRRNQLTCEFGDDDISESRLVRVHRPSLTFKWNVSFLLTSHPTTPGRSFLTVVHSSNDDPYDGLVDGDAVCAINGTRVGSTSLDSIDKVIKLLRQEVEVLMEIRSKPRND